MGWLGKVKKWAARDWEKHPFAVILLTALALGVIGFTAFGLWLAYQYMVHQ